MNPGSRRAAADAERVARFLLERTQSKYGPRWKQGARKAPFEVPAELPAVAEVAQHRLHTVPEDVAQGIAAFARGDRKLVLYDRVLEPLEVLELQAQGIRCASLLAAEVPTAPHEDARAFLLHDLCHLEKFVDPDFHLEQVGFFDTVFRATQKPEWEAFVASFDETFRRDFEAVVCDMNGSAIFLLAALKMKLKMATRRRLSGAVFGPLDERELAAYVVEEQSLFDLMALPDSFREDASKITTKRDAQESAIRVRDYFSEIGSTVLSASKTGASGVVDASGEASPDPVPAREPSTT